MCIPVQNPLSTILKAHPRTAPELVFFVPFKIPSHPVPSSSIWPSAQKLSM